MRLWVSSPRLAAILIMEIQRFGVMNSEFRKNSEIRNPKYCLTSVPRCLWQMLSRVSWAFPGLANAPTGRRWLRASDFGFLSAFGIRICTVACFTETLDL